MNGLNKLECLSLAYFSKIVYCFQGRPEPGGSLGQTLPLLQTLQYKAWNKDSSLLGPFKSHEEKKCCE
jgi:hypothetical protein